MTAPQTSPTVLGLTEIVAEVRRRASSHVAHIFDYERRDLLEALRRQMESSPRAGEKQALLRILRVLTQENRTIACRADDVAALGPNTLALLSALIEEFMNGRYTAADIREALFI